VQQIIKDDLGMRRISAKMVPQIWCDKWILNHDKAPVHNALRAFHKFLAKKSITKMGHPPNSPDVASCDFCLFPKLKKCPEGTDIC
jgi:hypothetical protein